MSGRLTSTTRDGFDIHETRYVALTEISLHPVGKPRDTLVLIEHQANTRKWWLHFTGNRKRTYATSKARPSP